MQMENSKGSNSRGEQSKWHSFKVIWSRNSDLAATMQQVMSEQFLATLSIDYTKTWHGSHTGYLICGDTSRGSTGIQKQDKKLNAAWNCIHIAWSISILSFEEQGNHSILRMMFVTTPLTSALWLLIWFSVQLSDYAQVHTHLICPGTQQAHFHHTFAQSITRHHLHKWPKKATLPLMT